MPVYIPKIFQNIGRLDGFQSPEPCRREMFQNDNELKYSANIMDEFQRKKNVKATTWPSMSPNLNPIKQLLGILKRKVQQHKDQKKKSQKNGRASLHKYATLVSCI